MLQAYACSPHPSFSTVTISASFPLFILFVQPRSRSAATRAHHTEAWVDTHHLSASQHAPESPSARPLHAASNTSVRIAEAQALTTADKHHHSGGAAVMGPADVQHQLLVHRPSDAQQHQQHQPQHHQQQRQLDCRDVLKRLRNALILRNTASTAPTHVEGTDTSLPQGRLVSPGSWHTQSATKNGTLSPPLGDSHRQATTTPSGRNQSSAEPSNSGDQSAALGETRNQPRQSWRNQQKPPSQDYPGSTSGEASVQAGCMRHQDLSHSYGRHGSLAPGPVSPPQACHVRQCTDRAASPIQVLQGSASTPLASDGEFARKRSPEHGNESHLAKQTQNVDAEGSQRRPKHPGNLGTRCQNQYQQHEQQQMCQEPHEQEHQQHLLQSHLQLPSQQLKKHQQHRLKRQLQKQEHVRGNRPPWYVGVAELRGLGLAELPVRIPQPINGVIAPPSDQVIQPQRKRAAAPRSHSLVALTEEAPHSGSKATREHGGAWQPDKRPTSQAAAASPAVVPAAKSAAGSAAVQMVSEADQIWDENMNKPQLKHHTHQ